MYIDAYKQKQAQSTIGANSIANGNSEEGLDQNRLAKNLCGMTQPQTDATEAHVGMHGQQQIHEEG